MVFRKGFVTAICDGGWKGQPSFSIISKPYSWWLFEHPTPVRTVQSIYVEHLAAGVVCLDCIIDAAEGEAKLKLFVICHLQVTECAIHGSNRFSEFQLLYARGVLCGRRVSLF
jgi:hypothetical protein